MPVVDVHAHIYPDKVAEKASQSIGNFYHIPMEEQDGSVWRLLNEIDGSDITRCVVHSVAVRPGTVESINDFISATCKEHQEFVGFMTLHQDTPDIEAEIERACGLGLHGIKLHPDTQAVNMDDDRLMPVYEIAERRGLPLIIHCGDYRYDYSHPRRLKRILHEFPQLVVDAAHFGGWSIQDYALEFLEDERCYLDMSSSMRFLGPRRTRELVETYGYDRILFGSDFPMWQPINELKTFRAVGFSQDALDRMCWYNTERFLGMDL
ncbi:MAG: TatD family hydrolase [Atopobiaceae bacterium]|jgi:predicted TIM-barrel fold metal-dependent hydrolase|nr:TatD family hydrolase [Atopobiaceae bacterium]